MKSMLGVGNLPFAMPLPNDVKSLIPKSSATKTIKLGLSSILTSGPFSQIISLFSETLNFPVITTKLRKSSFQKTASNNPANNKKSNIFFIISF